MRDNKERQETIKTLIEKVNPIVVDAIKDPNPFTGNCLSHLRVAEQAKKLFPDSPYLVLEDDAVIMDDMVWSLIDEHSDVDILYLGYNGVCVHTIPVKTEYVWGTHAVVMQPKARDALLETYEVIVTLQFWTDKIGFDSILTVVQSVAKLTSWKPPLSERYRYVCQKEGIVSLLSGSIRQNN
jgi:GR25 family glycosyltransferase involved in LPS biosynthesis